MSQTVVHTLGNGGPFFILCVYLHRLTLLLFKPSGNLSHNLTGGLLCPVDYDWSDSKSVGHVKWLWVHLRCLM